MKDFSDTTRPNSWASPPHINLVPRSVEERAWEQRLAQLASYKRLALVSIYQTDVTSFSKMEEVLNGYVTNPTPTLTATLTLTKLIKNSKKKQL
jgi:hypothetical protein